jgi:hypothetical protein
MFAPMGLLDLLVSKEQRLQNQKRNIERENRELEAQLQVAKAQRRQERLRKELDDYNSEADVPTVREP